MYMYMFMFMYMCICRYMYMYMYIHSPGGPQLATERACSNCLGSLRAHIADHERRLLVSEFGSFKRVGGSGLGQPKGDY